MSPGHEIEPMRPVQEKRCLNCGAALNGSYCSGCGQEDEEVRRPFIALLKQLLRVVLELDGRAYRSLGLLLVRPAYLTLQFVNGRRHHYTPPLRLFLAISIGFFVILSVGNTLQSLSAAMQSESAETTSTEAAAVEAQQELQQPEPGRVAAEASDNGLEGINELIGNIRLPYLSEQTNVNLQSLMRTQAQANYRDLLEDPQAFFFAYLEYITLFILVMIPVLALIQKIFFLGSGAYYIEHLVLSVHNHSFLLLMLLVRTGLDAMATWQISVLSDLAGLLATAAGLWIIVYLYLSLKFFFGRGYVSTALIFFFESLIYGTLLISSLLLVGLAVFLLF